MDLFWRVYERRTNVDSRTTLVPAPPGMSKVVAGWQ